MICTIQKDLQAEKWAEVDEEVVIEVSLRSMKCQSHLSIGLEKGEFSPNCFYSSPFMNGVSRKK